MPDINTVVMPRLITKLTNLGRGNFYLIEQYLAHDSCMTRL